MNDPQSDKVIRITKEEALSGHVEDLLKRQMSLRGDPGVTRERRRSWFYQNWFVFGLVGALGAFAAWALIEPHFHDMLYFQGKIDAVTPVENRFNDAQSQGNRDYSFLTSITIKGEQILLMPRMKEITSDGRYVRFSQDSLQPGDTVGVYLERERARDVPVSLGRFIVRSPAPQSAEKDRLTLDQMSGRQTAIGLLVFPVVAGLIGLFIGAADGFICRLPRRAFKCGAIGLFVGFVGGFIGSIAADIIYTPLTHLAMSLEHVSNGGLSSMGFGVQLVGRALAWGLAGTAMGLGQGIALRSKRLLLYGLLGGLVGGLLGGMFFDPIDMILIGPDRYSAALSRAIGFVVVGLGVGVMIGLVELLARDAWLRMTQGPLAGKEFLIFKDVMNVGSSPHSDIYLFNDPQVAEQHAVIRGVGDECEIEARQGTNPVLVNSRSVTRARLRHGDNVTIGRTSFVYQQRKT